jgi:hypothetical protein
VHIDARPFRDLAHMYAVGRAFAEDVGDVGRFEEAQAGREVVLQTRQ